MHRVKKRSKGPTPKESAAKFREFVAKGAADWKNRYLALPEVIFEGRLNELRQARVRGGQKRGEKQRLTSEHKVHLAGMTFREQGHSERGLAAKVAKRVHLDVGHVRKILKRQQKLVRS